MAAFRNMFSFWAGSPSVARGTGSYAVHTGLRAGLLCLGWALAIYLSGFQPIAFSEDVERAFIRAQDAFESAQKPEEFLHAAVLFESILSNGYENGAVYYNLGNAYMRAGKVGKAIGAYRRAKRYLPRDPYLDANLRAALDASPSGLAEAPTPWWHHVLFWHEVLSQNERQCASASAWVLAFLLALLRLFLGGSGKPTPSLKWLLVTVLAAGCLMSLSMGLGYQNEILVQHGVVINETKARKGNGENYGPAFDKDLKEGAEFTVLESRENWYLIQLPNAGEGWVPAREVMVY